MFHIKYDEWHSNDLYKLDEIIIIYLRGVRAWLEHCSLFRCCVVKWMLSFASLLTL